MATITGTPGADQLDGTANADHIEGRGGNDTIRGLDGNDTLVGGSGEDLIEGGEGNDQITSGGVSTAGGRDTIFAGNGDDFINLTPFNNGGPLVQNQFATVHGGAGNDTYFNVVGEWTTIVEEPGGGIDTVRLLNTTQWTLPDGVENLFSFANASSDLTGNGLANHIVGGGPADTLRGEGGNDTLDGGYGADKLYGGADDDILFGTLSHAPSEADGAADRMEGGTGNDTYFADTSDTIVELAGEGVDHVFTGASTYVLSSGVENLTSIKFSGDYSRNFTGNELGNRITAGTANDRLDGGSGEDMLIGGAGDDTLVAGLGNDSLIGGDGVDTVQLTGLRSDYQVLGLGNDQYRIKDLRAGGGDGQDVVTGVERLLFADGTIAAPADLSTGVNNAPQGQADAYTVAEDGVLQVPAAAGLLANDSDADGDPLTVELVQGPTKGSLTLNPDGSFSYTPSANYNGSDSFTYRVGDGLSFSNPVSVGINVESVNDAPEARDDSGFTTQYQTALTIASTALLNNDSDPDGGNRVMASVGDAVGGSVILQQNGDVIFTPAAGYSGPASFRYTMHDGQGGSDSATVSLTVGAAPPPPPPLDDEFQSTAANEIFDGGAGNDTVDYGTLAGGVTVTLASTRAQNTGAGGLDTLIAIENLEGTAQNDRLTGNAFANRLDGGGGHDALAGGAGNDLLIGGAGDDRLDGGEGEDRMVGGAGNDLYTVDSVGDVVDEAKADGSDAGGIDTVNSSISYTLGSTVENLTLTGTAALNGVGNALNNRILGNGAANRLDGGDGSDTLTGGAGNDMLNGDAGDDRLDGGTGDDSMRGGAGNDSYVVDSAGDVVDETNADGTDAGGVDSVSSSIDYTLGATLENLALTGSAALNGVGNALNNRITGNNAANRLDGGSGNDTLSGGAGNDTLNGEAGDDKLDGGLGDDRLAGGAGNDSYVVDSAGDVVDEANPDGSDAGGIDSVSSTVGYTLAANLENLTLTGAAAIDGVGNARDNRITGNNAANRLEGGGGNDTLTGSGGMDSLFGGEGADTLNGGTEADILFGDAGNDRLDGGAGADRMEGGAGDDSYAVDDAGDVVTESREDGSDAGGLDTVISSVSHRLGAYLENLTLTGAAAIDGAGNGLANRITGNAAANRIDGGGGNDTLTGGAGADNLRGGEGDDRLSGGEDADQLFGDAGNDNLDGGAGADVLIGGAGDDSYLVDNAGDAVSESKEDGTDAGGVDLVNSLVSFTLGGFIENLSLTGTANSDGTGNDLANRIIGNGSNNVLKGGAGNDTLVGGAGNDRLEGGAGLDTLTGGIGADTFVFASPAGGSADRITDFVSGTDALGISAAAFGLSVGNGLTADGDLDPSWFVSGAGQVATASGHGQFVYDSKTKALMWDADGAGGAAAVAITTMNTAVTVSDFLII